jgi:NADH-quinone oxidoreductase subunit M
MVPLIGLIVFLGIYPKPVLERIEPSVRVLIAHVQAEVPSFHPATPAGPRSASGSAALTTGSGS